MPGAGARMAGSVRKPPPAVGGGSAYPYYPSLDTSTIPWAAEYGAIEVPTAPTPSASAIVDVTTVSAFNTAAAVNGARVNVTARLTGSTAQIAGDDITVTFGNSGSIDVLELLNTCSRVRISGLRPNGTHGIIGHTGEDQPFVFGAAGTITDIIVEDMDIGGYNGLIVFSGCTVNRFAMVNTRCPGDFCNTSLGGSLQNAVIANCALKYAQNTIASKTVFVDCSIGNEWGGNIGASGLWLTGCDLGGSFTIGNLAACNDIFITGCDWYQSLTGSSLGHASNATAGLTITGCTIHQTGTSQTTMNGLVTNTTSYTGSGNTFTTDASLPTPSSPPGDPGSITLP